MKPSLMYDHRYNSPLMYRQPVLSTPTQELYPDDH
ncbi:hypothetical protein ABIB27_002246 [Arthrobacter sp. UYEF21]